MSFFRWFRLNGEDREFMYLHQASTKQEILDFLNEFRKHFNIGDLFKITHSKRNKQFYLWDARQ